MIRVENISVSGWEAAVRGMRNPMDSWAKSDSRMTEDGYIIGEADAELMRKLVEAGSDHRKFLRFLTASMDIAAPLYWWKEYDTYKVGTVANSCSTMHRVHAKPFALDDFSTEHLFPGNVRVMQDIIAVLNREREAYLHGACGAPGECGFPPRDKRVWLQFIQLLPSSYNQRRTVLVSYEALRNMYHARKAHKLDEWRVFCRKVEQLPYAWLITGTGG